MNSAGVSSLIDIFKINYVDDTTLQEVRSVIKKELKAKTNDSDNATISGQFVVLNNLVTILVRVIYSMVTSLE